METRSVVFEKNKDKSQYWAAHIIGQSAVLRFDLQTCILAILKYFDELLVGVREIYKIDKLDLEAYKYDELVALISDGTVLDQVIVKERQFGYARVLDYPDTFAYEGAKAREIMARQLEARTKEIEKTKELKGTIASQGGITDQIIEGNAFVITTAFDTEKHLQGFKAGDILVATQTHPNLVPLMQQALAIVTDEGGITCHAAIVSRELGKPCIIGTKLATKIFKTGDRIVLDFNTGMVKKVK
jgi:pyruvate,water dikinase